MYQKKPSTFPDTVQAIAITRHGGLDVVEKMSVPFPKQEPNHIVVKVNWCGVNTIDTYFRNGIYPLRAFPQVLGNEASGTIVALPTDPKVLEDERYKARGYKIGQRVALIDLGTYAEYVSHNWIRVSPVPDEVPQDVAAAVLAHGLTVVTQMNEAYNVQKGDTIFIHTIAGGLALLFTAYAKARGATVIGSTSTPEKAKRYGADHVLLYTKEDIVQRALEITNGEGVHAVFDGVGKDTFLRDFDMLRRKGTLVLLGNASGVPDPVSPLKLSAKNLKLMRPSLPSYLVTPEEVDHHATQLWNAVKSGLFGFALRVYTRSVRKVHAMRRGTSRPLEEGSLGKFSSKLLTSNSGEGGDVASQQC